MVSTTGITSHNAITLIRPQPGLTANAPHTVSAALAGVAATGSTARFFLPGVLSGPDVMNGSARGTALVMLVVGLPVLLGAMLLARRGSDRAVIVLLGTAGYLAYNAVMLLLATPFNQLFLLYVATLSLALASVAAVCAHLDVRALAGRFAPDTPARGLALCIWVVVALNALAWLRVIVPALGDPAGPSFLRGHRDHDQPGLRAGPGRMAAARRRIRPVVVATQTMGPGDRRSVPDHVGTRKPHDRHLT